MNDQKEEDWDTFLMGLVAFFLGGPVLVVGGWMLFEAVAKFGPLVYVGSQIDQVFGLLPRLTWYQALAAYAAVVVASQIVGYTAGRLWMVCVRLKQGAR